MGVPGLGAYLAPAVPTREFALPGWPGPDPADPDANLAAGRALLGRAAALEALVLPRLRARLGLPGAAGAAAERAKEWPIVHGYSPAVVPRPADWPAPVQVGGYWWPATPPGWQPPAELVDFLAAGPKPVFVGFGSMMPGDAGRLGELVAAAVDRAGVRAVVQAGWSRLAAAGDDVLAVGDVPHEWLFPRCAAAVHHAGAGTTGAALRAGIPSIPAPVLLDQPFWARRLVALGVAPAALPLAELTAPDFAAAIRATLDDPRHAARAAALGARIRAEDGAAPILTLVDR